MSISQEKLNEFQARMNNWVASQGLMFQLTHGGGVRGAHSSVLLWFFRMFVRILMLGVVAAVLFWGYLVKRVDFSWFRAELNESVASGLGADETTAGGIKRSRGHLEIAQMELVGGEHSFFNEAWLRGVRAKMGLFDGVVIPWNGETILVEQLEMDVRAGAESEEAGREIFERIFEQSSRFRFSRVEASRATIRWGYSGVTRGEIKDAQVSAVRRNDGWEVVVTGGTFSQNWLQHLDIERMEVAVRPDGLEIREARLRRGHGEVSFTARVEGPTTRPVLSGSGRIRSLSIDSYLQPEVREFLGADLSGSFEIGGSPYAASGVTLTADLKLEGDDRVELRDRLPLFKAISVVDRFRSYRNVRFTSGSFKLETGGAVAVFTDIRLQAKDIMRLEGEFLSRRPTKEEVDEALKIDQEDEAKAEDDPIEEEEAEVPQLKKLTLREAAKAAREKGTVLDSIDSFLMSARAGSPDRRRYVDEARARQERAPMLEGTLRVGLSAKSLERAPELAELYPVDRQTGLRWLDLPLEGNIYEAGIELAEKIYTESRHDQ